MLLVFHFEFSSNCYKNQEILNNGGRIYGIWNWVYIDYSNVKRKISDAPLNICCSVYGKDVYISVYILA